MPPAIRILFRKWQMAKDDAEAMQDAAKFARRVRRRLGLSQLEFSQRIDVSLETIRNWEQGKRRPTGAAKALLKVLDKVPEAALSALAWAALCPLPILRYRGSGHW